MFVRFAWPLALAVALGQVDWLTIQLDPLFRSEGVAVGDVNRDGRLDILAGEVWYEAPTWQRHDLAPPGVYDPINGYSDCFVAAAADVDQDGWVDLLSVGFPGGEARWYRNPQGAPGYWAKHAIAPNISNESPQFLDVDGDGRIDLLGAIESPPRVAWLEVGPDPTKRWTAHPISNAGQPGSGQFYHGLGFGDVDGDGRRDALTPEGWYESPSDPRTGPWPFHAANLMGQSPYGPQMAAQIHAYDFDGDGDADLATSSPHAYGMWWWERTGAAPGAFTEHRIADWFSQSHALALADIDGDGLADLLSGKRWYAHGPTGDPGSQEPAVLVWFRLVHVGGQVRFERHLIDADSGVGTQFLAVDVNADGSLDVVTSNKKGVFLHLRRP